MYDKLIAKVNNIDTSGFVLKTKFDKDNSDMKKIVMLTEKVLILLDFFEKNRR